MDVWAQSYIALYPLLGQVDYGFVKFILMWGWSVVKIIQDMCMSGSAHSIVQIVANKSLSIDVWSSASAMLGVKVRDQLSFLRFLESDNFETEVRLGRVQASD